MVAARTPPSPCMRICSIRGRAVTAMIGKALSLLATAKPAIAPESAKSHHRPRSLARKANQNVARREHRHPVVEGSEMGELNAQNGQ